MRGVRESVSDLAGGDAFSAAAGSGESNETGERPGDGCGVLSMKKTNQKLQILNYFKSYPFDSFTPHEVNKEFPQMLITSVRRVFSDLTDDGFLIKTTLIKDETHGKQNRLWKINPKKGGLKMANREACELLIEQEIKDGLEQGKKPYSIGKDIAAWVEKLFEVKIKPTTLEKRAERIKEILPTNVGNNSQPTETIKDSAPEIIADRQPQGGGAREKTGPKVSQNKAWKEVEKKLKAITEYMKRNCEITPEIDETLKINIRAYIDLLNTYNDEL